MSISLPRIGRVTLRLGFPVGLALLLVVVHACGGGDSPTGAGDQGTQKRSWTLTVTLSGDGVGTVTSQPSGIDCSSESGGSTTCAASFEEGSGVTLTAAAGEGDVFQAFSKGCTGTTCTLTLSADTTVDAAFDNPMRETKSIGATGDSIHSAAGDVSLSIPAGALSSDEIITIDDLDPDSLGSEFDTIRAGATVVRAFKFGPDGLTFDKPITVTLPADSALQDDGSIEVTPTFLFSSHGGQVDTLRNVTLSLDSAGAVITGELGHFSELVEIQENNGESVRFFVGGIPQAVPVGVPFTIHPRIVAYDPESLGDIWIRTPLFWDQSLYLDPQFDDLAEQDKGNPLKRSSQGVYEGSFTYKCTEAGRYSTVMGQITATVAAPLGNATVVASHRVQVDEPVECTSLPKYTLKVTVDAGGQENAGGTVASDPAGIACGSDCQEDYTEGTKVTLTATPQDGWYFQSWEGDCDSTDGKVCVLTMAAPSSVTAHFTQEPELAVNLAGSGNGTVTSNPAGISCPTDCVETYVHGTAVVLTATPDASSTFVGWSGQCISTHGNVCNVTMDDAKLVTATFVDTETDFRDMILKIFGNAVGSFTSDPSGLENCARADPGTDATCSVSMPVGQDVRIIAHLDGGTSMNWIGSCSEVDGNDCLITNSMDLPTIRGYVVAEAEPGKTVQFTVTKEGQGTVRGLDWDQANPGQEGYDPETIIDCGDNCQAAVKYDRNIQLVATPDDGWIFKEWADPSYPDDPDCAGSSATIKLASLIDLTCKATFRQLLPPQVTEIQAVFPASIFTPTTTEYSVEATDPMNGTLSYDWKMEGEECGDPKVPWEQTGRAVDWSHSSSPPDNCQHVGTDHQVTAYVTVTSSASGLSVTCSISGSENLVITNPTCSNGQAGSPSRFGSAMHGALSGAWTLSHLGYRPASARHRPWRGPPFLR